MTRLHQIGKWINLHYEKFGRKPKVIPISAPEKMEILSDYYPQMVAHSNSSDQIYGIDTEESPWAEMTRQRILDIGVERLSMDARISSGQFNQSQHTDWVLNHLVTNLTANILADVTHLDVSFDWDRLSWLKRKVKWIGSKWPVKRKAVRIEGKVLYPYLKIQAPADTHRVRFLVKP